MHGHVEGNWTKTNPILWDPALSGIVWVDDSHSPQFCRVVALPSSSSVATVSVHQATKTLWLKAATTLKSAAAEKTDLGLAQRFYISRGFTVRRSPMETRETDQVLKTRELHWVTFQQRYLFWDDFSSSTNVTSAFAIPQPMPPRWASVEVYDVLTFGEIKVEKSHALALMYLGIHLGGLE